MPLVPLASDPVPYASQQVALGALLADLPGSFAERYRAERTICYRPGLQT